METGRKVKNKHGPANSSSHSTSSISEDDSAFSQDDSLQRKRPKAKAKAKQTTKSKFKAQDSIRFSTRNTESKNYGISQEALDAIGSSTSEEDENELEYLKPKKYVLSMEYDQAEGPVICGVFDGRIQQIENSNNDEMSDNSTIFLNVR